MSDRSWFTMVPVYGAQPVGSTTLPFPAADEDGDGDGSRARVADHWKQMVRGPAIGAGEEPGPDEPTEQPSDAHRLPGAHGPGRVTAGSG
ncbi:hypothetical protein [Streptomyces canarius]